MNGSLYHNLESAAVMSATVIQLTDLHLLADTAESFKGCNPWRNLNRLLAQITSKHLSDKREPDLFLLTGDLCQDHSPKAAAQVYRMLAECMDNTGVLWQWIPGNHDQPDLMKAYKAPQFSVQVGDWEWLLLNSCSGQPFGELAGSERQALLAALAEPKARYQAVAVHHQPLLVGPDRQGCFYRELTDASSGADAVSGIDRIPLRDGDWLWCILQNQPQVKAVVCGHVHQDQCIERDGLTLYTTPATSVQFAPNINGFEIDEQQPGYRQLTLYDDGHLETEVRRLSYPVA